MPQVHFFQLDTPTKNQMVCLQSKYLYDTGQMIFIHTKDEKQTKEIDNLLWEIPSEGFLPHASIPCDTSYHSVLIGHQEQRFQNVGTIILAKDTRIEYAQQFSTVVDFAESYNGHLLERSRQRFRQWKKNGFLPHYRKNPHFFSTIL